MHCCVICCLWRCSGICLEGFPHWVDSLILMMFVWWNCALAAVLEVHVVGVCITDAMIAGVITGVIGALSRGNVPWTEVMGGSVVASMSAARVWAVYHSESLSGFSAVWVDSDNSESLFWVYQKWVLEEDEGTWLRGCCGSESCQ